VSGYLIRRELLLQRLIVEYDSRSEVALPVSGILKDEDGEIAGILQRMRLVGDPVESVLQNLPLPQRAKISNRAELPVLWQPNRES
jgi:hypothetical protein